MRRTDESDLDYWARRHAEVMELVDKSDGEVRAAHLALADSYMRLIKITSAGAEVGQSRD